MIDSQGRLVHWFDALPRGPRGSLVQSTLDELRKAIDSLKLNPALQPKQQLTLPDLMKGSRGIRVTVTLKDNRMKAYQAPVVEIVKLQEKDWKWLAWPERQRSLEASALKPWLEQVYPPGIMERTNPRTKMVYKINSVAGRLTLTPADKDQRYRYAVLDGTVKLTDEGTPPFSYQGQINLVLAYPLDKNSVKSLRGVFEGVYPRYDRIHNQTRHLPLQAVFESRPE